jgi:hypothetical protein
MSTTIAENANRDMYLGDDGNVAFLTDVAGTPICTAQLTKSRVESQRGEMMYAADQGMPTRATAWDTFNPKQFEAAARSIMNRTANVTGVSSFALTQDGNELDYTAEITTTFGTATVTSQ